MLKHTVYPYRFHNWTQTKSSKQSKAMKRHKYAMKCSVSIWQWRANQIYINTTESMECDILCPCVDHSLLVIVF